jgi:hypothetical protein
MKSPPPNNHARMGSRLGPRLAKVVSMAMSEHLQRTAHTRSKLSAEGANEFFRGMSREKWQHIAPLWAMFEGDENTPAELEALLNFIAHGQGEAAEVLSSLGMGQAVGTSILSAIQNFLAPANQRLIAAQPNTLLEPATIAQALAANIPNLGDAYAEAARGGVNAGRLNVMKELAEQFPGLPQLIELWRRGFIDVAEVKGALERQGVRADWIAHLVGLKREHLGPPDAALAVLRGHLSQAQGAEIAAVAGINQEDFNTLVYNTGEPPGLMQLLEAYRRGFIDQGRLNLGIRQSRVRDEWHDVVEKLRFTPASPADAVNAVVQGHLDENTAKQIAEWGGLRPEDFGWLVKNAGNPISPEQALSLFNRGIIPQSRVEEALREGRTKDKYIPNVLHLRVKLPPVFQTVKAVETGGISPAKGAELLHHEGYEQDVIAGLVHSATSEQSSKARALAASQVTELYEEQAFTEAEALDHLQLLGLTRANAALTLRVADLKRERTIVNTAVAAIKSQYAAKHITEAEASTLLDKLRLPTAQRDLYLQVWTIQRAAERKVLTPAQVVAANKAGLIKDEAAEQRLMDHGYTHEDAQILLDLEKGRTVAAP